MKCYLWKICVVALLCTAIALDGVSAKKKSNNKYEGDFEFVDEVSVRRKWFANSTQWGKRAEEWEYERE